MAATWLLKAWCEAGLRPDRRRSGRWAGLLAEDLPWEARLHLLQSLEWLDPSPARWRTLVPVLGGLTRSERPFLQAWAAWGLGLAVLRLPDERARVEGWLVALEERAPASVRVRLRKVRELWARGG